MSKDARQEKNINLFDTKIDRTNTGSTKWDKYEGKDVLPMWVADTDFRIPEPVIEALHQRVDHGVFGYTHPPKALTDTIVNRMAELYQWNVEPDWIVYLPGLVCGLNIAARALCDADDTIMIPTPIYPPFASSAKLAGKPTYKVPTKLEHGRWLVDLDAAKADLPANTGLLQFCNPLNPGGTVYRKEELEEVLLFAQQNDLVICSDEIHCDLILDKALKHIPLASLSRDAEQRTVTLMAPSKTFNIAGLGASFAIIPNESLRTAFRREKMGIVPHVSLLAYTAAQASYQYGQAWLDEQLVYLALNRDLVQQTIDRIPGLALQHIEATYLAWIDCKDLPVKNPCLFFEKAGVGLSPGIEFGDRNFVRLNFGCTKKQLMLALQRMEDAINAL
ncbi:aspartate aminotransferase [Veronia nyctiphanis]|uniref:cysteine-S-conjugate beta-lyase n=1 Tax=Veronia nyctiphanis TaxID=1278244 RepID=A0A4Q0YU86_9GAMM|nr:PatB family C-S lyase [Veronia nyctiphanis]RXJ74837.1 aspartate aminotransferase [Veronia nyctiphanis]